MNIIQQIEHEILMLKNMIERWLLRRKMALYGIHVDDLRVGNAWLAEDLENPIHGLTPRDIDNFMTVFQIDDFYTYKGQTYATISSLGKNWDFSQTSVPVAIVLTCRLTADAEEMKGKVNG